MKSQQYVSAAGTLWLVEHTSANAAKQPHCMFLEHKGIMYKEATLPHVRRPAWLPHGSSFIVNVMFSIHLCCIHQELLENVS